MESANLDKMIQAMFQGMAELRASQAKTDKQIAKTDKQIAELRASQAKTDKQIAELRASQKETGAQLKASQAKTDKQIEKMSRKLESVGQLLGSIGINTGDFAEELFYTSLKDEPRLGSIQFELVERNIHDRKGQTEHDILMHNGEASAIIEVKYKAHIKDIQYLLERKPKAFRQSGEYNKHKLYLGLATSISHAELIAEAKEAGIFLLTQQGKHVELVNEEVRCF